MLIAAMMLLAARTPDTPALDLKLRCDGVGTFPEAQSTFASVHGSNGYASGSATTVGRGQIRDRVLVEVSGETARIRLPRALVPAINSGGRDGWWELTKITVGEAEIGGQFRLNPFNKPTVRIDRTTGSIEVQGSFQLSFRGECEIADPAERRF